jgi:hypothetical protein
MRDIRDLKSEAEGRRGYKHKQQKCKPNTINNYLFLYQASLPILRVVSVVFVLCLSSFCDNYRNLTRPIGSEFTTVKVHLTHNISYHYRMTNKSGALHHAL